ncbi:MAG TPA: AraC family transcriptional regulator [Myxococcaceae bacterium]|nr:AraC family transcriptional regulator [Myxococcaceae bacterium]
MFRKAFVVNSERRARFLLPDGCVDPGHDPLVLALDELRLRCVVMGDRQDGGPWRRAFPADALSLHVVLEGGCLIDADVHLWRYRLDPGELLVVNRAVPGVLRATCESDPPEVLSARVHLEAPLAHPMLEAFPALIRTSAGQIPRSFGPSLQALREELAIPTLGGEIVTGRLCEILFVQALRAHLHDAVSWTDQGWFRMLADSLLREQLAQATEPGASVASVATAAGRSRQRTHARFRQFGGTSPSAFIRHARVRRAAELLRSGEADLARIAAAVGFGSRQALCRAFRRELGVTPAAQWRAMHLRPFPRRTQQLTERDPGSG